ncbi:MAG: ABC transporter substrate-binding protein [Candidatus Rokubacteria bacterium]|nr:ABC transporter substrate-binding protein [Candidatus Rokubacteria bacterium]MBI3107928.1 ABC transporter substrate-binding protein [Candidatus Rokubacteria bacterium]
METRREFLRTSTLALAAGAGAPIILTPRKGLAQGGLKTIPVAGLIGAAAHNAALETARAKGFLEANGLKMEPKEYAAGAFLIQALAAGDIVAGVAGDNPSLLGRASGVDLKILANSNLEGSVLVVGPRVKGPKDLHGKKVGTPGIAAIQDTLMVLYEEKHGIKTDHVFVKVTDMPTLLSKGEIAGYMVWEVTGSAGLAMGGGRVLATSKDIRGNHECCVLVASGKFLRGDPDAALRLVRAFDVGLKHAMGNREELVQIVARRDGLEPDLARRALTNVRYKYPPFNDPGELSFIVEALMKAGKIEKGQVPDVRKFVAETMDNRMIRSLHA